ncbi:piggyBac transposable element-derived protein 3-like [Mercenaria mercenaria]|uniref:piggyBac transposable element-derived protein 3-like n=1 Tax=Mercenaria mercenaria TaxID=6596 RepID=UPI00234F54A4|nr:piggyBac transposable element-derived protein 3-like [Mercenaria mercenaria]
MFPLQSDTGSTTSGSETDEYEVPADLSSPSTSRTGIRVALRDPPSAPRPKRPPPTKRKWLNRDIPRQQADKFTWRDPHIDTSRLPQTPKGIFELFFDDDILDMMVEQSIRYAGSKGNHTFTTSREELGVFMAILIVSGYSTVPRRRMYWSHDTDVRNDAIASAMTRDRFDTLVRYIHLCDNASLDQDDKFSKVRPLLSLLNERFVLYFPKQQNLSIDESMIPYYGRHGAKQFIRGKPIRFGYKMWALTTPLGYLLQFEPYQGARGRQAADTNRLGMGGAVVMDLLVELNKDNAYHLTFDNLFTSLRLVDELSKLGIACTGTVRSNRVEDCPLRSVKEMAKTERGTYDKAYDANNGLIVIRWNDNNIVNVVSNVYGVEPVQTASRWSRAERRRIRIKQPDAIRQYNQTMGGVDRMDQNVGKYRISIRSKKWWWPIFAYCIDLTVQQTWHLYRSSAASRIRPLDLLGYDESWQLCYLLVAEGVHIQDDHWDDQRR